MNACQKQQLAQYKQTTQKKVGAPLEISTKGNLRLSQNIYSIQAKVQTGAATYVWQKC